MNSFLHQLQKCCSMSNLLSLSSACRVGHGKSLCASVSVGPYPCGRWLPALRRSARSTRHSSHFSQVPLRTAHCRSDVNNATTTRTSRARLFTRTGLVVNRCIKNESHQSWHKTTPVIRTAQLFSNRLVLLWRFGHRNCSTKVTNGKIQTVVPKASDVTRLLALAKPEKWRLIGGVGLLLISSAVTMAVPFGIGKVIDIIYTQESGDMLERLWGFCKMLLLVFVIGAVANMGRVYLMRTSGQHVIKRMREKLFGVIVHQEIAFFDRTRTGELINRLSTDVSIVGQSVTTNVSDGLRAVAQAIGGVAMMFYVSPTLAVVGLSIVPPVALVAIIYGRYVRSITRQVQDALAESTQVAEERLANIRTVRTFVQESKEFERYNKKITKVLKLSYKEALASGIFFGCTGLSGNLIILSVIYQGGVQMNQAIITVGELSSFLMYAAYVGVAIGGLSTFYTELMRGLGASSRIWDLIDRRPAIPLTDGLTPSVFQGTIAFEDVQFSYPTRRDFPVCQGLSLTVPQGTVLAVVGASGSGKSTLASLLLRLYDPDSGRITVDGIDIRELSAEWLRNNMGVVSQEPALFSCSIAENIAYGAVEPSRVTPEDIIEAAKKANAYTFIRSFPDGMETMVGERGAMLSGGQKQRIAIARAILKNPKVLLLDEATSALDAESEHLVQEALERVMVGRTVVTIAHRLSTIRKADSIAVLYKGHITELGTYDKLMTITDGHFRRLVERQTIGGQGEDGEVQPTKRPEDIIKDV